LELITTKTIGGEFVRAGTGANLVDPGGGRRFTSHERARWMARDKQGNVAKEWVADIADGIVQDIIIR
jgi:hypothetical protein